MRPPHLLHASTSSPNVRLVDLVLPLRVSPEDEAMGLNLSQHGETVYEDRGAL